MYGTRTRVAGVRNQRPRPLDEHDMKVSSLDELTSTEAPVEPSCARQESHLRSSLCQSDVLLLNYARIERAMGIEPTWYCLEDSRVTRLLHPHEAPRIGIEPITIALTARRTTVVLPRNETSSSPRQELHPRPIAYKAIALLAELHGQARRAVDRDRTDNLQFTKLLHYRCATTANVKKERCEWPECPREATRLINLAYLGEAKSCTQHEDQFFELNAQLHARRHDQRD